MCLFFYSCLVSLRRKPSGLYLLNKFCEETLSPGELLPVTAQNGCEEFILTKRWHNTVKEYLHALVLSFFPFSFFPFEMQLAISNLLNLDFTLLCFSFWSLFSSSIFKATSSFGKPFFKAKSSFNKPYVQVILSFPKRHFQATSSLCSYHLQAIANTSSRWF